MTDRTTTTFRAMARTRWLSELSEALERAGKVARELGDRRADGGQAPGLSAQIDLLVEEVDSLRRAKPAPPTEVYPDWTS